MNAAESTTAAADALERRREVLDLTGWGLPFRLWQPHSLCFWLYVVFVVLGALQPINAKAPRVRGFWCRRRRRCHRHTVALKLVSTG
jgi:hypothetical protein